MEKDDGEFSSVLRGPLEMKTQKLPPADLWRGRPGLASRCHPFGYAQDRLASGREQGQDALATSKIGNRKSRTGFVLTLVIVAIVIIGIEMFVLAGMANTMQFQSHRAYLKACERNLLASGLAWARQNVQKSTGESPGQTIELDVSEMDILGSALEVTVGVTDDKPEVRIHTSCSRGRQTLRASGTYKIERYDQQETTPGTREGPTGD